MRQLWMLTCLLAICSSGCLREKVAFQLVDAQTGAPVQSGHALRYRYNVGILSGYSQDRELLPNTDAGGLTRATLRGGRGPTYCRFDARGYSPALAYLTTTPGRVAFVSPWSGNLRHAEQAALSSNGEQIIPMHPLPHDMAQLDTAALAPQIPDPWDGVWRLQVVDAATGVPMPGVEGRYYLGQPAGAPAATERSDASGLIAHRFAGTQPIGVTVIASRAGYRSVRVALNVSFVSMWIEPVAAAAPPAEQVVSSASPPHMVITVPMQPSQTPAGDPTR